MSTPTQKGGALAGLARFSYRRRRLILLLWIAGAVAVIIAGFTFGAPSDDDFTGGDSDSDKASSLIDEHFPQMQGDTLTLAVKADAGVGSPAVRPKVERLIAELDASPITGPAQSPYTSEGQISPDKQTAFASISLNDREVKADKVKPLITAVKDASGDGVTFALGGDKVAEAENGEGGGSEVVGVVAAAIILFIAFGSLIAMGLPIITALFAIFTGLALVKLVGHLVPSPSFTAIVAALIGLGVGIDYALFIVTRYKESLSEGADPENAVVKAITTAGHAVLFAGTTVVIALMGLFVIGQRLMNGVAVAASVTVLMTMIASVTLLPAFLGFIGYKIDRVRLPRRRGKANPEHGAGRRTLAERWAGAVQRKPLVAAGLATVGLLVLAAPMLSMRLSLPDASTQPRDTSGYASHRILAEGFGPGYGAPLIFATEIPSKDTDLSPIVKAVQGTPGIAYATPARPSDDGKAAVFMAYPKTGYQDQDTADLVHKLRDDVLPKASGEREVYIGGPNAGVIDFSDQISSRLPWLIAVVIGLSLVLLVALIRSVTIALQAAVMNLLSIGAAYGVLVAIVQWGWLHSLFGFPTDMPVATWVPMMMFPILFGLSMDYEVFLVSRIREEYERLGDTRQAVTAGLARTAKVITAAAAIMIAVFTSSLLGVDPAVKQMGLGMAVAVLIDATIVRLILVPAVMEMFGKANWWMPGRRTPKTAPALPAEAGEKVSV